MTSATAPVPPFQLLAMTFAIAFLGAVASWAWRGGRPLAGLRQPWPVWLVGIGGLFLYHACYFTALRLAPAVEASLIAYLWPLMLVLFSALLPGLSLGWRHIAGVTLGLAGAALLFTGGGSLHFEARYVPGYGAAFACALIWAGYSLLSRRFGAVPSDVVGGFCGCAALLGLVTHLLVEKTVMPSGWGWLAVFGLGLGPVGAAFYLWDHSVKHGDIQLLGVAAYAAPVLSTLLLVAFGRAPASPILAVSCGLIVLGAGIAGGARRGN